MEKSKLYLVEDFDPGISYENATVVSLKPAASYLLEKKGISYSIPEDYYREQDLRSDEDRFFMEQLDWFDRFDEFLRQNISECSRENLTLARIHYNRFKYLIDAFIIKCRILLSILEKINPDEIFYVVQDSLEEGKASVYNFTRKDRHSYWGLVSFLSNDKNRFHFSIHKISKAAVHHQGGPGSREKIFPMVLKRVLKNFGMKSARNFKRYQKIRKLFQAEPEFKNMTVLFLDSGSWTIDFVIREFIARGSRVFIKNEREIYLASDFFEDAVLNHPQNKGRDEAPHSNLYRECRNAASKFLDSDLLDWANRWCSVDIREILFPYFQNFIEEICPQVIIQIQKLLIFYRENKIDFVIAWGSAGANYPAALQAAKIAGIKRVCFQHSVGPLDMKDWVVDELDFFDVNFVMNPESRKYFENYSHQPFLNRCEVFESSHYLRHIRNRFHRESLQRNLSSYRKPKVFYVPAKLAYGLAHFNTPFYPMTWYFEYQKAVMQFFAQQAAFNFVYKHSKNQKWLDESLIPWMKSHSAPNVSKETGPFPDFLKEVDRVIFDYPSTGLFESAAAGIPVLSLYHETMRVWEPMFQIFGKSLQRFSTISEALEKMEQFLKSDPKEYIVNLPLGENDAIDLLAQWVSPSTPLESRHV